MNQRQEEPLKPGKDTGFVKSVLRRLKQVDDTWEADFQALPKPMGQHETHYLALVVSHQDGVLSKDTEVVGRPSVNDLARLLAQAMRQPVAGQRHRPSRLHLRGHHQWRELFPHLAELDITVSVHQELPKVYAAYDDHLRRLNEKRREGMPKPTEAQAAVEKLFPAVAWWVKDGHIEIGDQEMFGFVARALDDGGQVVEDDRPNTLAEALTVLEHRLRQFYKEEGIDWQ